MKGLIKKYSGKASIRFYDSCENKARPNEIPIIGADHQLGAFFLLDHLGNIIVSRSLKLRGEPLILTKLESIVEKDGKFTEDLVALGFVKTRDPKRRHYVLIRLTNLGKPIWVKRLFSKNSRFASSLQCSDGIISLTGWHNLRSTLDIIEFHDVDLHGNVMSSHTITAGNDDQISQHRSHHFGNVFILGSSGADGLVIITRKDALHGNHPTNTLNNLIRSGTLKYHDPSERKNIVFRDMEIMNLADGVGMIHLPIFVATKGSSEKTHTLLLKQTNEKTLDGVEVHLSSAGDTIIALCAFEDTVFLLGRANGGKGENYVLAFDHNFKLLWQKVLDLGQNIYLTDIEVRNTKGDGLPRLSLCGFQKLGEARDHSFFIDTDLALNSCKTIKRELPRIKEVTLLGKRPKVVVKHLELVSKNLMLETSNTEFSIDQLCPDTQSPTEEQPELTDTKWLQSPYLYLSAVGSLGDVATKGHLLRWMFLRSLGDKHFPKGDYSQSSIGFNKPDDFVKIYRAPFNLLKPATIELGKSPPDYIDHENYRWIYLVDGHPIYLEFQDTYKYDQLQSQLDPLADWDTFVERYSPSLLLIRLRTHLSYQVDLEISGTGSGKLESECFSVQGDKYDEPEAITARRIISAETDNKLIFQEENIHTIELRATDCLVSKISFYRYSDLLTHNVNESNWRFVGKYALSTDDGVVFPRLEDQSHVHNHWNKFETEQTVNTQNYRERWSNTANGLKLGISEYLALSETDPAATKTFSQEIDEGPSDIPPHEMELSYFDLLTLASTDYHVARMMGLGHIDHPTEDMTQTFVYLAEYNTSAPLEDNMPAKEQQHFYISLPTALQNERPPRSVRTLAPQYGLELDQGDDDPVQITDAQGYPPFDRVRYIKLFAENESDPQDRNGFMQPSNQFSYAEKTNPVFGHILYREYGALNWRKSTISKYPDFFDNSTPAYPEVMPVSMRIDHNDPVFIHGETEEGIHEYSVSSIDIFSRCFESGNVVQTNFTKFNKPNTLLPPANIQAQVIQQEDINQLLLTTSTEQEILSSIPSNSDQTLIRVSFDYNHTHDLNYDFANQVEVYWREDLPKETAGKIGTISQNANDHFIWLTTSSYTYNSTGTTVTPEITPAEALNYIGGTLVCNGERYEIEDVNSTGINPSFKIKKIVDRGVAIGADGSNIISNNDLEFAGSSGDRFIAIENLASTSNWGAGSPHQFIVDIDDQNWQLNDDNYDDNEGKNIERKLRGFWEDAVITVDPDGQHKIIFQSFSLDHHPQFVDFAQSPLTHFVDYYKGVIRVPIDGAVKSDGDPKMILDVEKILNVGDGQPLTLLVSRRDSDASFTPILGQLIRANFYPGYRAYLYSDSGIGFTHTTIFPQTNDLMIRKTLLGLRSVDAETFDINSSPYGSDISAPQILFTTKVIEATPPQRPIGAAFVTPPNFYQQSNYSFTTEFRDETFGAVYYRANTLSVLGTLYKSDTLRLVIEMLGKPVENEFYSNHIQGIFGFLSDNSSAAYADDQFPEFPLNGVPWNLPNPDKPHPNDQDPNRDPTAPLLGFEQDGTKNPSEIVEKIKNAVMGVFTPLTEQPLIISVIRGGNYNPTNKPQKIRDKFGELLDPQIDTDFDLAPMAVRIDGTNKIRFTDFSVDGGEKSHLNSFLYMVREVGNRGDLSAPSLPLGPVMLIDKAPLAAPVINKIFVIPQDNWQGTLPSVGIRFHAFPESSGIKYIEILRSNNSVDALSPRSMKSLGLQKISTLNQSDGIMTVLDDFSDLDFPPFLDPLSYRLVAYREIRYQDHLLQWITEQIPSNPSKLLMTTIVDVIVPEGPTLTVQNTGLESNGELTGLILSWNSTTYNGRYYLEKQNSLGNWKRVAIIASNDPQELQFTFAIPLPTTNENSDKVYNRFRISAENSSGILGRPGEVITL